MFILFLVCFFVLGMKHNQPFPQSKTLILIIPILYFILKQAIKMKHWRYLLQSLQAIVWIFPPWGSDI